MPYRPPTPHIVTRKPKPYWCECMDKRIKGITQEAEECKNCSVEYEGKRYAERLLDAPKRRPRPLPFDECERQCSSLSPPPTPERAKFLAMEATRHDRHRVRFAEPVREYQDSSWSRPSPPIRETRVSEEPQNMTIRAGPSQFSSSPSRAHPGRHIKHTTKLPPVRTRGFVITNPSSDDTSSSPTESDPPWTPPPDSIEGYTPQASYAQIPEWPEYARPALPLAFATPTSYAVPSSLPLAECTYLPPEPSETQGVIPKLPSQQKSWQKPRNGPVPEVRRKY